MKFNLNKPFVSLLGLALSTSAVAEDIELYVNHDLDLDEKPRVLLIFDTSGSMAFSSSNGNSCGYSNQTGYYLCADSRLAAAQFAMNKVVSDNEDSIDFGLMRFKSDSEGGYVVNGVGSDSSIVRSSIAALPANGGTPLTETLWEAYLYITGKGVGYGLDASTFELSLIHI